MPVVTSAAVVANLWVAFELISTELRQGALQALGGQMAGKLTDWVDEKTGWKDKQREELFREAYYRAEERLIKKISLPSAYRIFSYIQRAADTPGLREQLLLMMLEEESGVQQFMDANRYEQMLKLDSQDAKYLQQFMIFLRQSLYETILFRPAIEFYAMEEARQVRRALREQMQQLSKALDKELQAIRVTIVGNVDFENERAIYLKQIEGIFNQQRFVGFPSFGEELPSMLLREIYIPLKIQLERVSEATQQERPESMGSTEEAQEQ